MFSINLSHDHCPSSTLVRESTFAYRALEPLQRHSTDGGFCTTVSDPHAAVFTCCLIPTGLDRPMSSVALTRPVPGYDVTGGAVLVGVDGKWTPAGTALLQ